MGIPKICSLFRIGVWVSGQVIRVANKVAGVELVDTSSSGIGER